jgi:hypothetical protein
MPRYSLFVAAATLFGTISINRASDATPNFPALVQQFVQSSSPPACTICHSDPNGGVGTVTTEFGLYLRSRGLVGLDDASLRNALTAAQSERHDSNNDGITDIDALRQGLDPSGNQGASSPPSYGCSVGPWAQWQKDPSLAIVGALAALGVRLRRRRLL